MLKRIVVTLLAILLGTSSAWAGENPSAKLAMHVVASSEYLGCEDLLPAACDSISVDVSIAELSAADGYGYVAFVACDVEGITGVEFAVDGWPTGRGAPQLSGPYWCPEGALTMGDHLGSGGITSFPCEQASAGGLVLVGYASFGPLDEGDLPITLEYAASSFSYPNEPHNLVLDCTAAYQEDTLVAYTGCTIGGTHEGQPDCVGDLGRGGDSAAVTIEIVEVVEIADGGFMAPAWSPDGNRLAFTRSQYTGLYVANADGGGPVIELSDKPGAGYRPAWTRDARSIVVTTRTTRRTQSLKLVHLLSGEIEDLVGELAHVGEIRVNAHGDVEFRRAGAREVLDMERREILDAATYYAERGAGTWNLDLDGRTGHLVILSADGGTRVDFPFQVTCPRLSPGGEKLAYYGWHGGLFVANVDGTELVDLGRGDGPVWSPDGRLIAYEVSQDDGHNITGSELFVATADGHAVIQLTDTPDKHEMFPDWSPDGTRIAYSTFNEGKIYVAVLRMTR